MGSAHPPRGSTGPSKRGRDSFPALAPLVRDLSQLFEILDDKIDESERGEPDQYGDRIPEGRGEMLEPVMEEPYRDVEEYDEKDEEDDLDHENRYGGVIVFTFALSSLPDGRSEPPPVRLPLFEHHSAIIPFDLLEIRILDLLVRQSAVGPLRSSGRPSSVRVPGAPPRGSDDPSHEKLHEIVGEYEEEYEAKEYHAYRI